MKTSNLLPTFMCLLIAFTGFTQEKYLTDSSDTELHSILELVEKEEKFSTFYNFIEASNLETSMEYTEGYTLFVPINEAFGEMELQKLEKLTEEGNQLKLTEFVKNYILPNKVYKREFKNNQVIDFENDEIQVNTNYDSVSIGGAQIIQSDIKAKDGVIHVIDELIISNDF